MYEPGEDSFLILKHIKDYACGICLDMGTGTGVLAKEAMKYASVVAVDIDKKAVSYAKKELPGAVVLQSNLFSFMKNALAINQIKKIFPKFTGRFDAIIFNPPYLPDDPDARDIALDGGKAGNEVILEFISESKNYLADRGKILLLASSLSGMPAIKRRAKAAGYKMKEIDCTRLFFEQLHVFLLFK